MENKDFLDILNKGVKFWNNWRKSNPNIIPDLSNLVLSETKPAFPNPDVEYKKRNFEGVNFNGVNLENSTLRGVNLRNAILTNCKFYRADLRKANLSNSDLSYSKFNLTNLTLTNLKNAKLYKVLFWETVLSRTNFFGAKGLETCKHGGPSPIDISTLKKSKIIPDIFLEGIGLSNQLIKEFKLSVKNYNTCFISYSHKDETFAKKLWNDLQKNGIRSWYAPENLNYGDKFRVKIEDAIQSFDKLIIILSRNSIKSGWVEDEMETIMEKEYTDNEQLIIPIRIDDFVWDANIAWSKKIKRTRHIGDFTNWDKKDEYKNALQKLIIALTSN